MLDVKVEDVYEMTRAADQPLIEGLIEVGVTVADEMTNNAPGVLHFGDQVPGLLVTHCPVGLGLALAGRADQLTAVERRSAQKNTDRKPVHRLAHFVLAVASLLGAKLIDWRNRWPSTPSPIR